MRIGIDIRVLSEGKITGVEVYTLNLLRALFELDRRNEYVLFSNTFASAGHVSLALPPNVRQFFGRWPNRLLNATFRFAGWPYIDRMVGGLDIFFAPRYLFTALSSACRLVVTAHDLSFVRYPEFFSWQRRLWHHILADDRGCQTADHIIGVSESTKNDLVSLYGIPQQKISVIYPGVSTFERNNDAYQILPRDYEWARKPFILFLGTVEPRKNVSGIIAGYNLLRTHLKEEIHLVIAGGLGWLYRGILRSIETSPWRQDIHFLSAVDEQHKSCLLRAAKMLVFPSFYEGFGFPPLEAMASGTPVIASYNSSLPEVLGDASLYVHPYNHRQLARAMQVLITDNDLRFALIVAGHEQVKRFSWKKTAEQTLHVFESCAREK